MRASWLASAAELIRRAKDAGRLRPDVVLEDLILMIMANDGVRAGSPAVRVAASRRLAALMARAFESSPVPSPQPPAPHRGPAVPQTVLGRP